MCIGTAEQRQIYDNRQALQGQINAGAANVANLQNQREALLGGNRRYQASAQQYNLKARDVTPTYSEGRQLVGYEKNSYRHGRVFTPLNSEAGQRLARNQQNAASRALTIGESGGGRNGGSDPLLGYQPVYRATKTQSGYVDATANKMNASIQAQQKQISALKNQVADIKKQNAAIEAATHDPNSHTSLNPELTFKGIGYSAKQAHEKGLEARGLKKPGKSKWWSSTVLGTGGDTGAPQLARKSLLG